MRATSPAASRRLRRSDVLETAAGTGVLTRALAARLARRRAPRRDRPQPADARSRRGAAARASRVEWRQADALALPFEDATFDAVVCQFGAMFFPDKAQGYGEARRVLKPGGPFLFNVWDRIDENEFADVVTHALAEGFPERSAAIPGAHAARLSRRGERSSDELARRGLLPTCRSTRSRERAKAPSPRDPAIAYCQGTPLRNEIEARDASGWRRPRKKPPRQLERRFGSGAVDSRIQAHVIVASG